MCDHAHMLRHFFFIPFEINYLVLILETFSYSLVRAQTLKATPYLQMFLILLPEQVVLDSKQSK